MKKNTKIWMLILSVFILAVVLGIYLKTASILNYYMNGDKFYFQYSYDTPRYNPVVFDGHTFYVEPVYYKSSNTKIRDECENMVRVTPLKKSCEKAGGWYFTRDDEYYKGNRICSFTYEYCVGYGFKFYFDGQLVKEWQPYEDSYCFGNSRLRPPESELEFDIDKYHINLKGEPGWFYIGNKEKHLRYLPYNAGTISCKEGYILDKDNINIEPHNKGYTVTGASCKLKGDGIISNLDDCDIVCEDPDGCICPSNCSKDSVEYNEDCGGILIPSPPSPTKTTFLTLIKNFWSWIVNLLSI